MAAGALALSALALSAPSCRRADVPDALIGRWVTDAPRYADRAFSIDRATITFGVGAGVSEVHVINGISTQVAGESVVHTVRYWDSGSASASVVLEVVPGPRPALRLGSHEELWVRDEGGAER